MKLITNILASFDTYSKGWSARKLSAFVAVVISAVATFKYLEPIYLVEVLMVWLSFAATCLGLVHYEQIQKNKIKNNEETTIS